MNWGKTSKFILRLKSRSHSIAVEMLRKLSFIVILLIFPSTVFTAEYILSASLDQDVARVGSPFPLVIRFYWDTCCIRAPRLSELQVLDADVTGPTTPEQYEEEIDGEMFGVYELQFTITPSQEGTLVIPQIILTGEIVEPSRVFSTSPDEVLPTMEAASEPLTIQVLQ